MMQEFTQEMKNLMMDTIRDIHTVIPAKIESFDPDRCVASVLPYGKFKKPDGMMMDYPKISDVPVYVMQSGGQSATIAFPVKSGDECLLLFSEQTLDTWRTGAKSDTDLRFDLSNAVAIVGMFSKPNPLMKTAVEKDAVIIDRNGTRITLLPSGGVEIIGDTTIKGNLTVTEETNLNGPVTTGNDLNVSGNLNSSGSEMLAGNLVISGNITAGGAGTIGGMNMNTHTHTSSEAGYQTSGPN